MPNRQLGQMTTICQFPNDTQRQALWDMRSWKQTICCRSCGCMALPSSPFQVRNMLMLWAGENFSITVKFSELEIGCKAANQIPKCMSLLDLHPHIHSSQSMYLVHQEHHHQHSQFSPLAVCPTSNIECQLFQESHPQA